ncbi:MAG: ABC transporter ATP-binding protein [Saprospiraceae bacterium]|nr:ABC transporter ATP-binding protein [Saprospiraceae bacterium]
MISIQNISKKYGLQQVLDKVNLEFTGGQSIALIGPNGSGKTTLIKLILGLVLADQGQINVQNQDISLGPDYRKIIGYMPQLSKFPEQMKVGQLFSLIKKIRRDIAQNEYDLSLYNDFGIAKMERKSLGALSGGMKQQVSAALAFLFRPEIIILDEPTAGLDPISNSILKDKVNEARAQNCLLITTSHILNDLEEMCNHVVYLMDGKIVLNEEMKFIAETTGEANLNKMVIKFLQTGKIAKCKI